MAINKNTIKDWFKTGLKPLQEQFWAWMDSYWHKDEKIPITAIDDVENILDAKADAEALTNHLNDANAHTGLLALAKIVRTDELLIFKAPGNANNALLESGDYCMGFVEGEFINANYNGGDPNELSSFEI